VNFTLLDIISVLIIYQSLLFVLFLIFNKKSKPFFIKVLIGICGLIIVHFTYMSLENQSLHKGYFLGPFFGLLYGPLYYWYTRSLMMSPSRTITMWVHFIPACLALLFLFFLNDHIIGYVTIIGLLVTAHFVTYLLGTLRLIFSYRKQLKHVTSSLYNISLFWLEVTIYIQLLILIVTIFEGFSQFLGAGDTLVVIIYGMVLILINCFYHLGLKQVRLFIGLPEETIAQPIVTEYAIPETTFNEYVGQLSDYFETHKPYLEFDLSLNDLSEALQISPRNMSHIINKKYGRNFYDFINQYRLDLAKTMLLNSEKPIKEIMYDSGFSNKATFNALFKKSTNLTPTQYRQQNKS